MRVMICFFCFFFKQKTAYEMRISDWSSDVCSSDLLAKLRDKVRLSITPEGLRIEILDEADFAMFDIGTNRLSRAAAELLVEVGGAISTLPNPIAMRGHTDSLPYNPRPGTPQGMNNWILSSQRAEATRAMLAANGEIGRAHV